MSEVAIIGAGELGGGLAHVLARRDAVGSIRLIDDAGRVAEGKALDIAEAAPIEGFATVLAGSTDLMDAAGARVFVLADRAGSPEGPEDEALLFLKRIEQLSPRALVVCAGAGQRTIVERGVRELHIERRRLLGSAPEALTAAVRAIVALELDVSPGDVALAVMGVPPGQTVIAWEDATVAGFALTRSLDGPSRRRLAARVSALWPPGPYALAHAAVKIIEALLGRSRRLGCCFVAPDDSTGIRMRAAALPVRFGPPGFPGIAEVVLPALSVAERVALDNALLL